MDEPSSGLDPLVQREFQKMVREKAADGHTVFLSSHTLSEVQRVADRIGIIRQGHLVAVESVSEIRSKAMRQVELELDSQPDASIFEAVSGARDISVVNNRVSMSFDGDMGVLLQAATDHYAIVDINIQEASLEEIFLTYYDDDQVGS